MRATLRALPVVATALLTACIAVPGVRAQSLSLTGWWSVVSLTVIRNGTAEELLGAHPETLLIFGNDGRYVLVSRVRNSQTKSLDTGEDVVG
jgi:hypothetical protein